MGDNIPFKELSSAWLQSDEIFFSHRNSQRPTVLHPSEVAICISEDKMHSKTIPVPSNFEVFLENLKDKNREI